MSEAYNEQYVGLYYPYMHFRDERWLKLNALYWDEIQRLVPDRMAEKLDDSPTVAFLKKDCNRFITAAHFEYESEVVSSRFMEAIDSGLLPRLRERYGWHRYHQWPTDGTRWREPNKHPNPLIWDPRVGYVVAGKLSEVLYERLLSSTLAQLYPTFEFDENWLGMHPELADIYMRALAAEVAARSSVNPVTDRGDVHVDVAGWTIERIVNTLLNDDAHVDANSVVPRSSGEVEQRLLSIAVELPIPDGIEDVPIERIFEVRSEGKAERLAFRRGLNSLVKSFSDENQQLLQSGSEQDIERHLKHLYANNIENQVEALKGKLSKISTNTTIGLVSALTLVPLVGGQQLFIGIGKVCLGMATAISGGKAGNSAELQKAPFAYLVRTERDLQPTQGVDEFLRRVRRLAGN
jgi:hypothetical protein